jgi:hypothetical protein
MKRKFDVENVIHYIPGNLLARSAFVLAIVLFAGCRLAPRPPNTPRDPKGPSSAVSGETLSFTTSTTDSDGDSVAFHLAWGDGDTSAWSRFVASGESVTASHAYRSAGCFYVRAQARDSREEYSGWTNPAAISVFGPPAPTNIPAGTTSGVVGDTLVYRSSSSDSLSDTVRIRFDWGDGDTSDWSLPLYHEVVVMSHVYQRAGGFAIRSQARDRRSTLSVWSVSLDVWITPNDPPDIPIPPEGPIISQLGDTLVFRTATTDPNGDSVSIHFDLGDGSESNWSPFVKGGETISVSHVYLAADSFYVRAQARDKHHAVSGWSGPTGILVEPFSLKPLLGIRDWYYYSKKYYIPTYWDLWFGGYAVDTTYSKLDSICVHAKIDCYDDTLVWEIADSLLPGDSAVFSYSALIQYEWPQLEKLWIDGQRRLK